MDIKNNTQTWINPYNMKITMCDQPYVKHALNTLF